MTINRKLETNTNLTKDSLFITHKEKSIVMKERKRGKKRSRKFLLWLVIVSIVIGIIIEIWLENYYSIALIIPILYLNNIRKTL